MRPQPTLCIDAHDTDVRQAQVEAGTVKEFVTKFRTRQKIRTCAPYRPTELTSKGQAFGRALYSKATVDAERYDAYRTKRWHSLCCMSDEMRSNLHIPVRVEARRRPEYGQEGTAFREQARGAKGARTRSLIGAAT